MVKWAPNGPHQFPGLKHVDPYGINPRIDSVFLGGLNRMVHQNGYIIDPEFFVDPIITIGHH